MISRRAFLHSALATAALPFPAGLYESGAVFAGAEAADPHETARASKWTSLLERRNGWLGADGIYSIDLRFDAKTGQTDGKAPRKTLFLFSDTICGTTKDGGTEYRDIRMMNHSFAILEGAKPDRDKIRFFWRREGEGEGEARNIVEGRKWLQDGVRYGDHVWLTALTPGRADKPERIEPLMFPLDPNTLEIDFTRPALESEVNLTHRAETEQVVLGVAIADDAEDGFLYVYGYVDRFLEMSRKDAVVARVPREKLADYGAWEYRVGDGRWSSRIEDLLSPDAVLARGVSAEYSVSRLPGGERWIMAFTPGCVSNRVGYRLGDAPDAPFGDEKVFYRSEVPTELPGVSCYNAKAHPALSTKDALLVSYNVNRLGALARKPAEYRPRFVELPFEEIRREL